MTVLCDVYDPGRVDERPAVALARATGHDRDRRRLLVALATATEAPPAGGFWGGLRTALRSILGAFRGW